MQINMNGNKNLVSIKIVRGSELSEAVRAVNGITKEDFVEIRVERNSPATPKIIKLDKSPANVFSQSLKSSNFQANSFA